MKKFALLCFLAAAACGPATPDRVVDPVTVAAGSSTTLGADMAAALSCAPADISWSVVEGAGAGTITQTGLYTAPGCGSAFLGATVHVQATGCGHSAVANVTIGQEVVESLAIAAAIVNPGTAGACLVPGSITGPFPLTISVPMNGTVADYARLTLTCSTVFNPTLPVPLPPACP